MADSRDRFFIPSSYSRIVARELGLHERELGRLLEGTGLPQEIMLPGDETHLTGEQQVRLLRNARRLADNPEIGLRLGRALQPSAHGPLGYLVLSSPDLITALESLRDFLPVRIPFAELELTEQGRWLRCSISFRLRMDPPEERILMECFALMVQSVAEAVIGRELTEGRVEFGFARPAYHRAYGDYIHPEIRFSRSQTAFLLPSQLARTANASGEPASYAIAHDLCRRLLQQVPATSLSMADRVRRLLLTQLTGSVAEEDVARALFVSKRTLGRRLEREGTGYRRIRDEVISQLAARHLRDTELSVEAVAVLLGYHDSANFRRAFRRWFGTTPAAYRTSAYAHQGAPGTRDSAR